MDKKGYSIKVSWWKNIPKANQIRTIIMIYFKMEDKDLWYSWLKEDKKICTFLIK